MNQFNISVEQMKEEVIALGYVDVSPAGLVNHRYYKHILLNTAIMLFNDGTTGIDAIVKRGHRQVLDNHLALSAIKNYINNK